MRCKFALIDLKLKTGRRKESKNLKPSVPARARTVDPMIKSHLLYQLSYGDKNYFTKQKTISKKPNR